MSRVTSFSRRIAVVLLAVLLLSCARQGSSLADAFPTGDRATGWTVEEVRTFDRENLYSLVDGQADAFFAYGFEQVGVRRYTDAAGIAVDVEIWQVAVPVDAWGLLSVNRSGTEVNVGNGGDADPGLRLTFWQDRYYVRLFAREEVPQAELESLAQAISAALPQGGEPPALLDRLPAEKQVERSAIYFHEEVSIQDRLWLGGENLLQLGPQTEGVLARYDYGETPAQLMLIQYPDAAGASAALAALQSSQVEGLAAAGTEGSVLGAVVGQVDPAAAESLLADGLR